MLRGYLLQMRLKGIIMPPLYFANGETAGRRMSSPGWQQACSSRAVGRTSVRDPLRGQARHELPGVVTPAARGEPFASRDSFRIKSSSSGSATSSSKSFDMACIIGTTGCASRQPPSPLDRAQGPDGKQSVRCHDACWACIQSLYRSLSCASLPDVC